MVIASARYSKSSRLIPHASVTISGVYREKWRLRIWNTVRGCSRVSSRTGQPLSSGGPPEPYCCPAARSARSSPSSPSVESSLLPFASSYPQELRSYAPSFSSQPENSPSRSSVSRKSSLMMFAALV